MKRFPAFSLVEIAIGLFIVGLLLTAVMKGSKLIDSAKLQTCIHQIMEIQRDFDMWFDEKSAEGANPEVKDFPLKEHPKIGGKFLVEVQDGKHYLSLTDTVGSGFLSLDQIKEIKKYFPNVKVGESRVSIPLR